MTFRVCVFHNRKCNYRRRQQIILSMMDSTRPKSSLDSVSKSTIAVSNARMSLCSSMMKNLSRLHDLRRMFVIDRTCSCCVPFVSSYDEPNHQLCVRIVTNRIDQHQTIRRESCYRSRTSSNKHRPVCQCEVESLCIQAYHTPSAA